MNKISKNLLSLLVILSASAVFFFLLRSGFSEAASFGFFLDKTSPLVGEALVVDLKIDSENVSINAAQTTVKFPSHILKVESLDKTDSIFNFWLVEPNFDNTLGEISFIGGSTISGYSGKSLQALRIKFRVIGGGAADLVFSDTAISAADGTGANVLSVSKGVSFNVLSKVEFERAEAQEVAREAELAKRLPAKPVLEIPLYPDSDAWHNTIADFSAKWDLPKDVSAVAAVLDQSSKTEPTKSSGVFDNKNFTALSNGVWYLHVRFKNNIGWGPTNHYKIGIDTEPPPAFEIVASSGLSSDEPRPNLRFESSDQFSGIKEYAIIIDNGPEITTPKSEFILPTLYPGKHSVQVVARDLAGNATTSRIDLEVLPIQNPEIHFVTERLYVGEGGFAASGISIPDSKVLGNIKLSSGETAANLESIADEKGFWTLAYDLPMKKGVYYLEVTAEDERGAHSLPIRSEEINLTERPIISIFGFGLTYKLFLVFLLAIVLVSFGLGSWTRKLQRESRQRNILIAERDVNSQLLNIKKDVASLIKKHKTKQACTPKNIENEVNYVLKKIEDNIQKNSEYILENIEEIG